MVLMRVRSVLLVPVLSLLAVLGAVTPAHAAVVDVQLTQDGPQPQQLRVQPGDSVRFVNTDTFVHRVMSDSSGWAFGPETVVPGESYTVEPALTKPGTYAYRGAGLDLFRGTVVVPGATASASPSRSASPAPAPAPSATVSASPGASASPSGTATPGPASTGGTGSVQGPPPLAGGSFQDLSPAPLAGGPAPQVAPGEGPLTGTAADPLAGQLLTPGPSTGADGPGPDVAAPDGQTAQAAPGSLASPVEARRYGLPLALAGVLLTGVVSLLVRLLLAEAPSAAVPVGGPA